MTEAVTAYLTVPLALILSVPLTFVLFSRFPPYRAAFLALLVAALVLPVGYGWELKGVTTLNKATIPLLSAFAACMYTAPTEFRHLRLRGATLLLVLAVAIGPLLTAMTNGDTFSVGGTPLPALSIWDGVAIFRWLAFSLLLPFLLGRMLVREVPQIENLLRPLVLAFLVYSVAMLFEIRMSPQLHLLVYGYFPHSFAQQARSGGFRPAVFVGHGLPLAIITSFAVLASVMLWRRGKRVRGLPPPVVTFYLGAVVILCKTFSAVIYEGVGGAVMFFASAKIQARIAVVIACIVLAYPLLRSFDLFPTTMLTSLSDSASEERSESLAFRFTNEDLLLAHARERPYFGWGSYGRNRVFDEEGVDVSVTDGLWIILLGEIGTVGFLSVFGMMLLPVFQCGRALRNVRSESDRRLLASLSLLVALNWADSLPNALSGGVLMVFVTGAFSGVVTTYQRPRPMPQQRKKANVPAAGGFGSLEPLR
ncbi:MAG: hypothetical protein ACHQ6T_12100 [Myxococcota bacterium]